MWENKWWACPTPAPLPGGYLWFLWQAGGITRPSMVSDFLSQGDLVSGVLSEGDKVQLTDEKFMKEVAANAYIGNASSWFKVFTV
jgi:hypothetical protein